MCRESDTKLHCSLEDHNYFKSGEGNSDVDSDIATEESETSETEGLLESYSEPIADLTFKVNDDGTVEGPHVCPICKRNFHSQETFSKHVNTHVDSNDLTCKVCACLLLNRVYSKEWKIHSVVLYHTLIFF